MPPIPTPPGVTAPSSPGPGRPRAARGQGGTARKTRTPRVPDDTPVKDAPLREITDKEITEAMAEILSLPAFAFKTPRFNCDICAEHFKKQGPETAKDLVKFAENSPALRGALVKLTIGWNSVSLLPTVLEYVAVPIVHHGPDALQPVAPLFGLPPREIETHTHEHSAATAGTSGPKVQPEPPIAVAE